MICPHCTEPLKMSVVASEDLSQRISDRGKAVVVAQCCNTTVEVRSKVQYTVSSYYGYNDYDDFGTPIPKSEKLQLNPPRPCDRCGKTKPCIYSKEDGKYTCSDCDYEV